MNASLIDTNFISVSVLEDMQQVGEWLREHPYYVIVDEDLQKIGIVTAEDVIRFPNHKLIDCDFIKPLIMAGQNERAVFEIMKSTNNPYLPVYNGDQLIGVLSIFSLAEFLIKEIDCEPSKP